MPHPRSLPAVLLLVAVALLTIRCAPSEPVTDDTPDEPEEPAGPAYTLLAHTDTHIVAHMLAVDEADTLHTSVERVIQHVAAPNHDAVAFTYASDDSLYLARYAPSDKGLQVLHAHPSPANYSVAWHPTDDAFAYGVYTPTPNDNRGAGTVRIAQENDTHSVGCSASTEVLAWLSDGELSVRDDENLYVVGADDCATQATLDIRRHHQLTYHPSGRYLAYIYRTLEYNRSANEYQPDSSLYVSSASGTNETLLFGNERAARHATWAPDTFELAVSVEEEGTRRIVVSDVASEETTFLVSPAEAPAGAQTHPHWSPEGDAVAFTLTTDNGTQQAAVHQAGSTDLLMPVTGPVWGWVDAQTIALPTEDGPTLTDLNGSPIYTLEDSSTTLIGAWPAEAVIGKR
ncbi:MAG: hypothetical protein PPP56_06120 [Longimonas sp.]|uniref:TolB family protein n=1 Tax=Longimonas sp. TaxID=2039626 RepID=UPI00335C4259